MFMNQHSLIKNTINRGLDVSYKLLFIGRVELDDKKYIQVHSDRFDLKFSKLYNLDEVNWAISKFLELEKSYKASEFIHLKQSDLFYDWT